MNRLLLVLLIGCTGEPVVLAELDGDRHDEDGDRCVSNDDCHGLFCDKTSCAAKAGTCRRYPVDCGTEQAPVCGCDGVTYFNDCLRRAAGIAAGVAGECAHGSTCATKADCADGAECARLVGSDTHHCDPAPPGSCWVLPTTCDDTPDRWSSCGRGPDHCVDTCKAIRSGAPHARALVCE